MFTQTLGHQCLWRLYSELPRISTGEWISELGPTFTIGCSSAIKSKHAPDTSDDM